MKYEIIHLGKNHKFSPKSGLAQIRIINEYIHGYNRIKSLDGTYLHSFRGEIYFIMGLDRHASEDIILQVIDQINKNNYNSLDYPIIADTQDKLRGGSTTTRITIIEGHELRKSKQKHQGKNSYYLVAPNGHGYVLELSRNKPSKKKIMSYIKLIKKGKYISPEDIEVAKAYML